MSKLSTQVAGLEAERDRLAEEVRRMRRAAGGNVLLVRRDGFSRSMSFHCPSSPFGDGLPYAIEQAVLGRMPAVRFDGQTDLDRCVPCRKETFERTSDRDEFGRIIYREV